VLFVGDKNTSKLHVSGSGSGSSTNAAMIGIVSTVSLVRENALSLHPQTVSVASNLNQSRYDYRESLADTAPKPNAPRYILCFGTPNRVTIGLHIIK
jgi:hypothetical protein